MKKPSSPKPGITSTTDYWYSIRYEDWHGNSYSYKWKESTSWINVGAFYTHCISSGARYIYCNSLKKVQDSARLSDIVQLKNKSGNWHHSIIITNGCKGSFQYSAHSDNQCDKPLSHITGELAYRIIRF